MDIGASVLAKLKNKSQPKFPVNVTMKSFTKRTDSGLFPNFT